jgi:dipeptidase E
MKENVFFPYGHNNFEMWTNLKNKSVEDLKDVKGIIIEGGNTFKLLKELKDSDFIGALRGFIKKDGIVYGISAGAIILTKNIITANPIDENNVNIKDLNGLNFLKDMGIFCHYEKKYDKEILEISNEKKLEIFGLPEGTGIYIDDDKGKIIGKNSACIFNKEKGKKKLGVGALI